MGKKNSPVNFLVGVFGIMTASVILLELGKRVAESVTATWSETHTTIVVMFLCGCVLYVFHLFSGGVSSSRASNSRQDDYEVLPPERRLGGNQLMLPDHGNPATVNIPQYNDTFFGEEVDL